MTSSGVRNAAIGFALALAVVTALLLVGRDGWPGAISGCVAAEDCSCEAPRPGLVAQPINAIASLAFVIVGVVMLGLGPAGSRLRAMGRTAATLAGWTVIVTGLGSFAFHASLTEWGGWSDLFGTAAVPLFVISYRWAPRRVLTLYLPAAVIFAGALAVVGTSGGKYVLIVLIPVAVVLEVRCSRPENRAGLLWALSLLAAGAVGWFLGTSGSALCEPESVWQWHGLWHLLAAAALGALFLEWRAERTV